MTTAHPVLGLADEFVDHLLHRDPLTAAYLGLPHYRDRVPDLTSAARESHRAALVETLLRCDDLPASDADTLVLDVLRATAFRELAGLDACVDEWTVTPLLGEGLPVLLYVASLTQPSDGAAAEAYLRRLRSAASYLDHHGRRLTESAASGRVAVRSLIAATIEQARRYLERPRDDPLLAVAPPVGWDRADRWRRDVEQVVRTQIRPAAGRLVDVLVDLLPVARSDERPGLLHVPGGAAAYACCICVHTTLPADPDELHTVGLTVLQEVREEITQLGRSALGLRTPAEVLDRMRRPAPQDAHTVLRRSRDAVRRAERGLPDLFRSPLPPPCQVTAMPAHLAEAGAPPTYAPPARDGSRHGAYLVNTVAPGLDGSWALEAACFHEAVPGHHAQLARLQHLDLPLLLSAFPVGAHSEGWGLYAEHLAAELELYSTDEQRLGSLAMTALRAARLVVDTGLHARGWTREQAVSFTLHHTPMPEEAVRAEVDRYIAWPGQALGYLVGQREILRLREHARQRLGPAFRLQDFHSAVLDHGHLPLPALQRVVERWSQPVARTDEPAAAP